MANWCSESETNCRKHPIQRPHPGVCPSCLRERLSTISTDHFYINSVSYSPSSSSSAAISPHRRHNRTASDVLDSIYVAISGSRCNSKRSGLKKSRSSIAFGPRIIDGGLRGYDDHNHNHNHRHEGSGMNKKKQKNKKKGGFWSKLLLIRSATTKPLF